MKMNNEEKAIIYDQCVRQSDELQKINSKLKSEYVTNIPPNIQNMIDSNQNKIESLVKKLNSLFD